MKCRNAAEQGNADAQLGMGLMYDEGEGVVQDIFKQRPEEKHSGELSKIE